jgi:hypothetical protein
LKVVEKQDAGEAGGQLFELDKTAQMGARRMLLAAALETEAADYVERIAMSATKRAPRWWCTTARPKGASLPWERERWNCGRPRVSDRRRDEHGRR